MPAARAHRQARRPRPGHIVLAYALCFRARTPYRGRFIVPSGRASHVHHQLERERKRVSARGVCVRRGFVRGYDANLPYSIINKLIG